MWGLQPGSPSHGYLSYITLHPDNSYSLLNPNIVRRTGAHIYVTAHLLYCAYGFVEVLQVLHEQVMGEVEIDGAIPVN